MPADTYRHNELASSIGRFSVTEIDIETMRQATEIFDITVDMLATSEAPPVPHTDPELLRQAAAFDDKLIHQLHEGPASIHLATSKVSRATGLLAAHKTFCLDTLRSKQPSELYVEPQSIADAYGLPELWQGAKNVLKEEVTRYKVETQHPDIPEPLQQPVSLAETKSLLRFMWDRVVQPRETPSVNVYMTDQPQNYHVFWAPTASNLDYATPTAYSRATQLSFDLPHNATHLAHLDVLQKADGVHRYKDSMPQRAFFEAATVLSEYITMETAAHGAEFGEELLRVMNLEGSMTADELSKWVVADRMYEFKLRAVRLYADVLMLEGRPFEDTVQHISEEFGIPHEQTAAETAKYLPWTGLGGVYTYGYRKLLAEQKYTLDEVFYDTKGQPRENW